MGTKNFASQNSPVGVWRLSTSPAVSFFGTMLALLVVGVIVPGKTNAAPSFLALTGNYYDVVTISGPNPSTVTWSQAQTAAAAMSYLGMPGHLATISSQAENDFIVSILPSSSPDAYWIGGLQLGGNEPSTGWQWITGEPFAFTNWAPGEPNNAVANEDFLTIYGPSGFGKWNDVRDDASYYTSGYIIEYQSIPEPSAVSFFVAAAGGMLFFGGRRNKNAT